jgi:hypothetical protein
MGQAGEICKDRAARSAAECLSIGERRIGARWRCI